MNQNNESGYTLLLTLALILIITSFIGTLSFLTLNQQTQVEKTDEDFLLSDLTEMGIEYYRSRVFEDYVRVIKQVKEKIDKELTNSPELYNTTDKVEKLEKDEEDIGIRALITILSSYNVNSIAIEQSDSLNFSLTESPYEFESTETYIQFKFLIAGSNGVNQEKYSFNIRLPKNLVDMTVTNPGNGSGTIDYSKTIKDPVFTPPIGTDYCNENYTNTPCINDSDKKKEAIKDILNSTVYFIGNTVANSANNTDFKESLLIINGDLDAKNFNTINNVSIFVNGDTSIDQLNAYSLKLYSSGKLELNKHITINDSNIRVLGTVFATKKGMTISNTHMVLEGVNNTIDPFTITNSSTVCIKNDSSLDELYIDSTSSVFILNTANRSGQNSNGSKLPLSVDIDTFNKNCYGESNSTGGINVEYGEQVNFTPESILTEIDYDITD